MTQRLSPKYLILTGSLFLLIGFLSLACIFIENRDADFHQLFSQEIIGQTRFQPFLFTIETPYYRYDDSIDIQKGDSTNLEEWHQYFGNMVKPTDIKNVVYQSSVSYFGSGKLNDPHLLKTFAGNTCIDWLKNNNDQETLSYILFTRRVEPLVNDAANGWDLPQRDTVKMKELMDEGVRLLNACHKDFIKLRYAYQLVRLSNYTGDYEHCIYFYDHFVDPNKTHSVIRYWAQCTKAGALYRLRRTAEAEYNFAIVFDHCPSRRIISKRGFDWCYEVSQKASTNGLGETEVDPTGESNISGAFDASALSYCKDANEKLPLFALAASQWAIYYHTDLLDSIYRYAPQSDLLEWLAVRGLKQMERHILPFNGTSQWGYAINDYQGENAQNLNQRAEAFKAFQAFLQKCAYGEANSHTMIWNFFAGYAAFLNHDGDNSLCFLARARQQSSVPKVIADEIKTIETLTQIRQLKKMDAIAENTLVSYYDSIYALRTDTAHTADSHSLFWLTLADRFHEQKDFVKETFCRKFSSQGFDIVVSPRYTLIDSMINFKLKPNKTDFEKRIENFFSLDELYEVKGTGQLSKHQFTEALQTFQKMTKQPLLLPADPFLAHIKDCHDCDYELTQAKHYNRLSFAQKMVELQKLVQIKSDKQAGYCFELATGLYNITNFGNAWMATDHGLVTDIMQVEGSDSLAADSFFNCEYVEHYYKLAGQLSKDREFAAKSYFMAAKCEQNKYYLSMDYEENNSSGQKEKYRTFFRKIKSEYSSTRYYQQAIKECGYFKYYTEHNN